MMMQSEKQKLPALLKTLVQPEDLPLFDAFRLEIDTSDEVHIYGVQTVCLCEPQEILLRCRDRTVRLQGDALWLRRFGSDETIVAGVIRGICFL